MKYFIIAGEASGDLHAAQLISALSEADPKAQFSFFGGDMMAAAANRSPIVHYRDMAYMGFIEVAKHLRTIMGFLATARKHLADERPHALILVDYPSFNLKVAREAHRLGIPAFYFISPKVWAWKEYRVNDIKRYITRLYSILPFEQEFYRRHDYDIEYVGNPTVNEIDAAAADFPSFDEFTAAHSLSTKPIIAILPGSRKKEIRDNLPSMLDAALRHPSHQAVIAAAPGIDDEFYSQFATGGATPLVRDCTFALVHHSQAALVTSGTATLETALLQCPQVACYRMNGSKWVYRFYSHLIKGKYVTLPNLIADAPVIPELLLHHCNADTIDATLSRLLVADSPTRTDMLKGYAGIRALLGTGNCAVNAARSIVAILR